MRASPDVLHPLALRPDPLAERLRRLHQIGGYVEPFARRPAPPHGQGRYDRVAGAVGAHDRHASRDAGRRSEWYGSDGVKLVRHALEVERLACELTLHRHDAVPGVMR